MNCIPYTWRAAFTQGLHLYFRDRKEQKKHLEKIGVPGPKPNLFTGNLAEIKEKVIPTNVFIFLKFEKCLCFCANSWAIYGPNYVWQMWVMGNDLLIIMIISLYMWESGWEPHWQGASYNKTMCTASITSQVIHKFYRSRREEEAPIAYPPWQEHPLTFVQGYPHFALREAFLGLWLARTLKSGLSIWDSKNASWAMLWNTTN